MVLNGQDDGVLGLLEGELVDSLERVLEKYLGGQSVSVVDDRLVVVSVPDVEFNAAAAVGQHAAVLGRGGLAVQLMSLEVRVV